MNIFQYNQERTNTGRKNLKKFLRNSENIEKNNEKGKKITSEVG